MTLGCFSPTTGGGGWGEVEAPVPFNTFPGTNQPLVGKDPPVPGGKTLSLAGHLTWQVSEPHQNKNV